MALLDVLGSLGKATHEQLPGIMERREGRTRRAANAEFGKAMQAALHAGDPAAMNQVMQQSEGAVDREVFEGGARMLEKFNTDKTEQKNSQIKNVLDNAQDADGWLSAQTQALESGYFGDMPPEQKQQFLAQAQNTAENMRKKAEIDMQKSRIVGLPGGRMGVIGDDQGGEQSFADPTSGADPSKNILGQQGNVTVFGSPTERKVAEEKTIEQTENDKLVDTLLDQPGLYHNLPASTKGVVTAAFANRLKEQGKDFPIQLSDTANAKLGEMDAGLLQLMNLDAELANPELQKMMGPFQGSMTEFMGSLSEQGAELLSKLNTTTQVVAKAMEGGVLRAEDVPKYRKILPNPNDTPSIALGKIQHVLEVQMIAKRTYEARLSQGMNERNAQVTWDEIVAEIGEKKAGFEGGQEEGALLPADAHPAWNQLSAEQKARLQDAKFNPSTGEWE